MNIKKDISDNITTALTTLETDLSGDSLYKMIAVGKGSNITLNDTEGESLDDFKMLGKTVQDGTPSPTNPVPIENVKKMSRTTYVRIKRTDGTSEETYNFPLGDTVLMAGDYIDKLGIHHIREQVVFNGTENWKLYTSSSGIVSVYVQNVFNPGKSNSLKINGVCDYTLTDISANMSYSSTTYTGLEIKNLKTYWGLSNETVSAWTTWLKSHPMTIEHELATPTVTPLTSEQQTIFNEILQDGTYEVVTTYASEGNLAPDMEIHYHKDLQPRLTGIVDEVTDILQ